MALKKNNIGGEFGYDFIRMSGIPKGLRRRGMHEARPGVAGLSVWVDVIRGEVIDVQTAADIDRADQTPYEIMKMYEDILYYDKSLEMTYNDDVMDFHVVPVFVSAEEIGMLAQVGGLIGGSYTSSLIRAEWQFIVVDKTGDGLIPNPNPDPGP